MDQTVFLDFAVALGLGLLVGWQRERSASHMAGIRTFPLITLLGTTCGMLAEQWGGWIVAAGFLGVSAMALMATLLRLGHEEHPDPGQTTEAAALLMFAVGAYLAFGSRPVAVAVGGTVVVILHLKAPLQTILGRITEADFRAVMKFVAISLVILPVLPNQTYGPYDVWNPRQIWLMVCLIVAIGLLGYAAYRLFGAKAGSLLAGVLGGLISSTATTVSYSRRVREASDAAPLAAVVIMAASTVAFARILIEIAVVGSNVFARMAPPLAVLLGLMAIITIGAYVFAGKSADVMPPQKNPAQLRSALLFGGLYGLVVLGVAAAKEYLGDRGLYVVAIISGLTDMDAITLSTANLAAAGRIDTSTGWRLICTAALSNLVFKGGVVAVLGRRVLLSRVGILYGIALAGGIAILWSWPAGTG
jgi:uncharacterized membrane protein (DUF4010 family)